MPGKRQAGWPSLLVTLLWPRKRKVTRSPKAIDRSSLWMQQEQEHRAQGCASTGHAKRRADFLARRDDCPALATAVTADFRLPHGGDAAESVSAICQAVRIRGLTGLAVRASRPAWRRESRDKGSDGGRGGGRVCRGRPP